MALFNQIVQFILIISILVVLHELGHYLTAKWFKTKVEKFYLFFNPWFSLFKKKIGDTEYGVGWLPLGGYVKIAGMIDESMDTEQMEKEPQPWEFRSKPAWQRLIIMLGGIIVNILLAWFIYSTMLATQGDSYIPMSNLQHGISVDEKGEKLGFKNGDKIVSVDGKTIKSFDNLMLEVILADQVLVNRNGVNQTIEITDEGLKEVFTGLKNPFLYPNAEPYIGFVSDSLNAKSAGLMVGDRVTKVNGKPVVLWEELTAAIKATNNDNLHLSIERNGATLEKTVFVKTDEAIGILPGYSHLVETDEYSLGAAIPAGFTKTFDVLSKQIKQFKVIFKPKTEAYKQVKGPIGIVEQMSPTWDWTFFWNFTAMFSVWLAFVNILPIPALDGGHAMFLLYEMISGRPPSQKVLERGQLIGFIFIAGLMLIIFGNDIWNIVKKF